MNSTGTSYGLALASGINAYLPLLSFAIGARYFHWFTVNQNFIILLPTSRPALMQVVPFSQIQALALDQGILMGSLRLLTQQSQAYTFTILRDSLDETVDLVEMLHSRYWLPRGGTPRAGTAYMRPTRPQRI